MTTADRLHALAADVAAAGYGCHVTPADTTGRGGVWAFLGAATYVMPDTGVMCVGGRAPRLSIDVHVAGPGTAPGQLDALYTATDAVLAVCLAMPGWQVSGSITPGEYANVPTYTIPLLSL